MSELKKYQKLLMWKPVYRPIESFLGSGVGKKCPLCFDSGALDVLHFADFLYTGVAKLFSSTSGHRGFYCSRVPGQNPHLPPLVMPACVLFFPRDKNNSEMSFVKTPIIGLIIDLIEPFEERKTSENCNIFLLPWGTSTYTYFQNSTRRHFFFTRLLCRWPGQIHTNLNTYVPHNKRSDNRCIKWFSYSVR